MDVRESVGLIGLGILGVGILGGIVLGVKKSKK